MRRCFKRFVQIVAVVLAFPFALLCFFGRIRSSYTFLAHGFALAPGIPGSYLRTAFYRLTLRRCSKDVTIWFGSYFVDPDTCIGALTSIGSYCVMGRCQIGMRTQIGSHVLVPSGRRQHLRDPKGELGSCLDGLTVIGSDCWIGDGAIVMAEVGDGATIGAGAVVTHPISPRMVAAGNPARMLHDVSSVAELASTPSRPEH
jgi:virginiamycin A acetyltransferase